MHRCRFLLSSLVLSWLLLGGTVQGQPMDSLRVIELPGDLDRVLRDYETGWRAFDAEALAALFTEDGFIMRPGRPPVRGRARIAEAYAGSGGPLYLHAYHLELSGDVGYMIGGYRGQAEGPDAGKFILTLRKEAGRWMITADMDNGNGGG